MNVEEKANRLSIYGVLFVAGWIASSAYYQIPKLWTAHNVEHHQVVQLKAQKQQLANCIRVAVPTAKQAIVSANSDSVPTPSADALQPCEKVTPSK